MEETCTKIRRAIGEVTFAKLIPIENRAVNHEDARTIYSNRVKLSTKFLSRKSALLVGGGRGPGRGGGDKFISVPATFSSTRLHVERKLLLDRRTKYRDRPSL